MKNNRYVKFWGLIRWSLIRHKYLLPTFSLVQVAFAFAIVYGLVFLIPDIDNVTTIYLSSGAITLGIIAVGCVLAPQIISNSKQNGILQYQRTLPVPRSHILLADIIIWSIASLPGIIMGCMASIFRFGIHIYISFKFYYNFNIASNHDMYWFFNSLLVNSKCYGSSNAINNDRRIAFFSYYLSSRQASRVDVISLQFCPIRTYKQSYKIHIISF